MSSPQPFHLSETALEPGTSLIEASAGTGKTYAITALFVRLIVEQNLTVREILAVTYTEAATEELRHRVRQALVEAWQAFAAGSSEVPFLQALVQKYRDQSEEMKARLQNAICGFDEAPIYTIHGFCQRTLRDRAFESGLLFDTELVTDPAEFRQEIADDFWRKRFYEAGSTLVNFALKNGLGPHDFLDLLQTCGNHPRIEFLSQVNGRGLDALSAELESHYLAAREAWRSDTQAIKSCFGSKTKWGNKPYNKDEEMAGLFDELEKCFSESDTAFEALRCLSNFSAATMLETRSKRSRDPVPEHRFFKKCQELCETEQLWLVALKLAFVVYAKAELPRRKAERKIQYFDDLLTGLDQALSGPGGESLVKSLQARYKAALIDEFQDTDPLQYSIFRQAFAGGKTFLFLIGDPKQAIYGFRGADIFTYLEAGDQAARQFTLIENWRSESGLVTAVNKVFGAGQNSFVDERIRFQEVTAKGKADSEPLTEDGSQSSPLRLWFLRRDGDKKISKGQVNELLPGVVAREIVRLLDEKTKLGERALKPEDIAVLVPTNHQAGMVQQALAAVHVPSVLQTAGSVFESGEAIELCRLLAGIARPGDERLVKSALTTELFGVDGCQLGGCSDIQWQEWLELFHLYQEMWNRHGFFRMFRYWLQSRQVRQRLLAFPDGERRLTNLLHLGEILHQAETAGRLGTAGLQKWLEEHTSSGGEAAEEHQLRLERDDNAVRIVTIHKSKGLEYPVVFCLFAWKNSELKPFKSSSEEEKVFFHTKEEGKLVRDLGPQVAEEHRQWAMEERLAENVRLLYVALTRAKHRCYFTWGAINEAETSAPAWLFHRPQSAGGPLLKSLIERFDSLDDGQMLQDLDKVSQSSGGSFDVADLPLFEEVIYRPEKQNGATLQCRHFKGAIQRNWLISSFSYFKAGLQEEAPDRDAVPPQPSEDTAPSQGIFAFPGGAKAGTCLHEILEELDFQTTDEALPGLVNQKLRVHGMGSEENSQAVCQMLHSLLRLPLVPNRPDFRLSRLAPGDQLRELEFYFPIQNVSPARLQKFLGDRGWSLNLSSQMDRVAFDPVQGFLKGFIDLVFCHDGRFYVVDWKSNWLGNCLEDYTDEAIKDEMRRESYFLQYYLYSVALHKYLALRVPRYDYDRCFGGVIYLFLRGIDPANPAHGVFRDRPPQGVIEEFSNLLEGSK